MFEGIRKRREAKLSPPEKTTLRTLALSMGIDFDRPSDKQNSYVESAEYGLPDEITANFEEIKQTLKNALEEERKKIGEIVVET